VVVVEVIPFFRFFIQIYVVCVAKQLIGLYIGGQVWALDLSAEVGPPGLDVLMSDSRVFHVPVKLRLAFMAIITWCSAPPHNILTLQLLCVTVILIWMPAGIPWSNAPFFSPGDISKHLFKDSCHEGGLS
jgi:hypothetical protein